MRDLLPGRRSSGPTACRAGPACGVTDASTTTSPSLLLSRPCLARARRARRRGCRPAPQIDKILGKAAPDLFIAFLQHISQEHDARLQVDALRAYHFGSRYIVEVEIILPPDMTVRESHDLALALQHKVRAGARRSRQTQLHAARS